ncbi:MAG: hypothetical protein L3J06_06650 [Cyclobacteriaceae bacterium]|nr:hypothetical protein [Cyclobacteriaceae bacterium]
MGVFVAVSSFQTQNTDFQYYYRKCLSNLEYGHVSFILKQDSLVTMSWGGKPMPPKIQQIGKWWSNDQFVYIQDSETLKTYKKDTLIKLSVLVEKGATDFWSNKKKIIQDSIFSYLTENSWMYKNSTQIETSNMMEEMEYGLAMREICGEDILLMPPKSYLISNKQKKKKKKK